MIILAYLNCNMKAHFNCAWDLDDDSEASDKKREEHSAIFREKCQGKTKCSVEACGGYWSQSTIGQCEDEYGDVDKIYARIKFRYQVIANDFFS